MTDPEVPGRETEPKPSTSNRWLAAAHVIFWLLAVAWLPVALPTLFWTGLGLGLRGDGSDSIGFYAYVVLALFYAPALVLFGYFHGHRGSRFRNALRLGVAAYAGLLVAAAVARLLFPRYPTCGPHAYVAAATALPAIVFPTVATWRSGAFSRIAVGIVGATGMAMLVASVAVFGSDVETSLPLTFHGRCRWGVRDWQDYSTTFIRADGVDRSAAAGYAEELGLRRTSRSLDCPSDEWIPEVPAWSPPPRLEVWELDERVPQSDHRQFPSGSSGCFLRAGWANDTLYLCDICDWGI